MNRLCGSGLDAVAVAARAIKSGEGDFYIAGGVENMSRSPFVLPKAEAAFTRQAEIHDTTIGWRFVNPKMAEAYGVDPLGVTAENVASEHQVTRAEQDTFAVRSQQRAGRAQTAGRFADEIVKVQARRGREMVEVATDEHPRPETTLEQLGRLKPAFQSAGTVTAGNSSGVNDGAAAMLIASKTAVKELGLEPRARCPRGGDRWCCAPRDAAWGRSRRPASCSHAWASASTRSTSSSSTRPSPPRASPCCEPWACPRMRSM